MRRRELSEEELTQVINLKRAGTSWVKIQNQTGISRRTAKRAYEKWERSQTMQELKEARKEVAAAEFRGHMNSLITLAMFLVTNLAVPHLPDMMEKNAEQFFSSLWEQDLLQFSLAASVETMEAYPRMRRLVLDPQMNRRENELLFQSLQLHTREDVRWKALDEWKEARDNYVKVLGRLQKETSEVVRNFFNQEPQTDLLYKVKQASREDDPVKRIVEAVLPPMWQSILQDDLDQEYPLFETVDDTYVKSGGRTTVLRFDDSTDKSLTEKVAHICNLTANNLRKGVESDMVKSLQKEVRAMEKATEELREKLNPVKLTPIILRSRCDLCPA